MQQNSSNEKKNKKKDKKCCNNTIFKNGRCLTILAASTANVFAEKFTDDELVVLSLFFSTVGDALETIVAANAVMDCNDDDDDELILGNNPTII